MPWGGECLLMEEKYYGIILPRLPMSLKRMLESKIAPLPQYRKRSRVNEEMVDVYRKRGTKVEVNPDGEWIAATTIELLDSMLSRIARREVIERENYILKRNNCIIERIS